MHATSAGSYGVPSPLKMALNHTFGSAVYSLYHESHGQIVCVLPATNPQLYAPTRRRARMGRIFWKVLPRGRAMYSEQIIGLPYRSSAVTSRSTRALSS